MRILFVSGTSVGGAARSTHELASALGRRGHDVAVLSAIDEARFRRGAHEVLLDASVRLPGRAAHLIDTVRREIGRHLVPEPGRPYPSWRAAQPESAVGGVLDAWSYEVVVASSVGRPAWRTIRQAAADRGVATALYMRERTGIAHLEGGPEPDLLLANSDGHARAAAALGHDALVIPSLIDTSMCRVESTRTQVVYVNPVPLFGLDIALALAGARPDVPFTFVRSWPLDAYALRTLKAAVDELPNVTLQPWSADPRDVYRHARVIFAPYRHPGRPRVVAEAHVNAIPVLGSSEDGLVEAIGPGGVAVSIDAPITAWSEALDQLWDDPARYERFAAAAREHAARADMQPESILGRLEAGLQDLVAAAGGR